MGKKLRSLRKVGDNKTDWKDPLVLQNTLFSTSSWPEDYMDRGSYQKLATLKLQNQFLSDLCDILWDQRQ